MELSSLKAILYFPKKKFFFYILGNGALQPQAFRRELPKLKKFKRPTLKKSYIFENGTFWPKA